MYATNLRFKGKEDEVEQIKESKKRTARKGKTKKREVSRRKWSLLSSRVRTEKNPLEWAIRRSRMRRVIAIECDQFWGAG